MGLIKATLTRHTLQLPPGLAARMVIGADVAAPSSQASHSGLWMYPLNGLGSLEGLHQGFMGFIGTGAARGGLSGHSI